mmetsp:Transcript_6824/g.22091  ORF Transcript_6824/g.22091 Transcript_6824/m.22091 type:complete len:245 (+) Transcript_6824:117-851(+)
MSSSRRRCVCQDNAFASACGCCGSRLRSLSILSFSAMERHAASSALRSAAVRCASTVAATLARAVRRPATSWRRSPMSFNSRLSRPPKPRGGPSPSASKSKASERVEKEDRERWRAAVAATTTFCSVIFLASTVGDRPRIASVCPPGHGAGASRPPSGCKTAVPFVSASKFFLATSTPASSSECPGRLKYTSQMERIRASGAAPRASRASRAWRRSMAAAPICTNLARTVNRTTECRMRALSPS